MRSGQARSRIFEEISLIVVASIVASIGIAFAFIPSIAQAKAGCCSTHKGVCGCKCCDATPLSAKCAPHYPKCDEAGGSGSGASSADSSGETAKTHSTPALAEFSGKVIGVADGDTITVLDGTAQIKIRLNGVDCPEKAQAFGTKAKQFTSALVFGQTVTIRAKEKDRYGRTVGDVVLADGRILNHELVRAGYAWWYQKYAPGDTVLQGLEAEARVAKVGLWADPNAVAPWEFRRFIREK